MSDARQSSSALKKCICGYKPLLHWGKRGAFVRCPNKKCMRRTKRLPIGMPTCLSDSIADWNWKMELLHEQRNPPQAT